MVMLSKQLNYEQTAQAKEHNLHVHVPETQYVP